MKIKGNEIRRCIYLYGGLFKLKLLNFGFSEINKQKNKRFKNSIPFIKTHLQSGKIYKNITITKPDEIEIIIYYSDSLKRHRNILPTKHFDRLYFKYEGVLKYKSKLFFRITGLKKEDFNNKKEIDEIAEKL